MYESAFSKKTSVRTVVGDTQEFLIIMGSPGVDIAHVVLYLVTLVIGVNYDIQHEDPFHKLYANDNVLIDETSEGVKCEPDS